MFLSGWFLYFFIFIFALFITLFVPFSLRIKLHNLREDNNISIAASFFLFRSLKLFSLQKIWQRALEDVPAGKIYFRFQKIGRGIPLLKKFQIGTISLLSLGRAFYWNEFTILLKAGTGDPAITALAVGCSQALGGIMSKSLQRYWRFGKNPLILVYPSFTEEELKFSLSMEITTSLARIISRILFAAYKTKEATQRWQNSILFRT